MAFIESQDGSPIRVLMSYIQRCFSLPRFLVPLARSRISLDSPSDDHFICATNFNVLSLITAGIGIVESLSCYDFAAFAQS